MKKSFFTYAFLPLLLLAVLAGCSAAPRSAPASIQSETRGGGGASVQEEALSDYVAAPNADESIDAPTWVEGAPVAQGRKLIRQARFFIETRAFDEDVAAVRDAVQQAGGYFQESQMDGFGSTRRASMTIRVPERNYEEMLDFLRQRGGASTENTGERDATEEYVDNELRIGVLKQNLARLQALQLQNEDVEVVLALQREINNVLLQIEQLSSDLRRIDGLVDYATVTLSLQEMDGAPTLGAKEDDTLGQRMKNGFVRSTNGVLAFIKGAAVVISALLPVLLLLAVLLLLVFIPIRLYRRRHPKKAKTPAAPLVWTAPPQPTQAEKNEDANEEERE